VQEHNNENIAFHLGLINKSSVARDQRMAVLEKTLRSREMELAQLHKTIEKEREDRLEMMQQYDDRIQSLLELFEKKMESNSADCKCVPPPTTAAGKRSQRPGINKEDVHTSHTVRVWFHRRALTGAMLTATNVDKMRRTVDGLSYTMQVHKIANAVASPSCLPRKACACSRSG
jgi:hypothetical protein